MSRPILSFLRQNLFDTSFLPKTKSYVGYVFGRGWACNLMTTTQSQNPFRISGFTNPGYYGYSRLSGGLFGYGLTPSSSNYPSDFLISGKNTTIIWFKIGSLSSQQPLFHKGSSSNQQFTVGVDTYGRIFINIDGYSFQPVRYLSPTGTIREGVDYCLSIHTDSPSSSKIYLNGKFLSSYSLSFQWNTDVVEPLRFGYGNNVGYISANSLYIYQFLISNRLLLQSEIAELSINPSDIFINHQRTYEFLPDTNGTITNPGSDITVTGWTATPGPGYASMLNEYYPNDTNYVTSPYASTGGPLIMSLCDSLPAGSWNIRLRAYYSGSFSCNLQVSLLDASNNVVGTTVQEKLTSSVADHVLAIETTGIATKISISAI